MLIRICFFAILLAAAGCSRERSNVAVDAALLTQVPGDSVMVGAMRVKALKTTTPWKRLLEQPGVNERLDQLAKETSFDARKDLWEILWSSDGKEGLVYARGEFAPMGLEPKIEREGVQRMNYKGNMILGNEENAVWFVNSSTAVFGHTAKLRQLIDSRDSSKAGPSSVIREKINAFPPNTHFWMVADAAALPKFHPDGKAPDSGVAMNLMQNLPKLLQAVKVVTMQASLVDGLAMEMTASCADDLGARQVHDSLRGIVGIFRMSVSGPQREALLPVLDAVEVTQNQSETTMRARLTVQQFENLQNALSVKKEKRAD
ncbi:MAG: hypothetical protein HYX27_03215 [Acidobacteria bacterium]|nr:hypothetical protein [Acidobacteriota bacterium]